MNVFRIVLWDIAQVGGFTLAFGAIIALAIHLYEGKRDKILGPPSNDWLRSRFIDKLALTVSVIAAVILVIILNHVISHD